MGWVSKEQIKRARQIDVLDYILTHEPGNIRRVGSGYRLKDHGSLAIAPGQWYWHSQEVGGTTALDYLVTVRGYGFVDAVCRLTGEQVRERPFISNTAVPERKPFKLPQRNINNTRAVAYLQSRGIAKPLILACIERGQIYESARYHNCVFIGRDERGKARFAALRGTFGDFKCDAAGSDKQFGFLIPPGNMESAAVAIFESAVDALSHQTLCLQGHIPTFDGWRLSLGGTAMAALTRFLAYHPQVSHCVVCTDNDKTGELFAAKVAGISGVTNARSPPPVGKDWNDALLTIQKAERQQSRLRSGAERG